jgi:hypothetical protein
MGALDLRWRVWNTAVDTAANYNIVEVGMFSDDASGNIQNGIMFEYNVATGGNWFGRVYSATAAAGSTTGIAVAIGSWQTLRIVTNAAWTSIQFYVGNTLGCTVTSGYPVLNKILTPRFWMKFGAGTPTNNVRVDYCWYRLSVAR